MRRAFGVVMLALVVGSMAPVAARAGSFESCSKPEIALATQSIDGARAIVIRAAALVGDTPEYARWFGRYTAENAETVRRTLKAVDRALGSPDLRAVCPETGIDGCTVSIFANVWPHEAYVVNLCPSFFRMPSMLGVVRTSSAFETGTREGTIIHEVSHFDLVGGTEDHCYGRGDCETMARRDPAQAIANADSYQYFAEDVTFANPANAAP